MSLFESQQVLSLIGGNYEQLWHPKIQWIAEDMCQSKHMPTQLFHPENKDQDAKVVIQLSLANTKSHTG